MRWDLGPPNQSSRKFPAKTRKLAQLKYTTVCLDKLESFTRKKRWKKYKAVHGSPSSSSCVLPSKDARKNKGKEDYGVLVDEGLCERLDFRVRVIVMQVCVLKIS